METIEDIMLEMMIDELFGFNKNEQPKQEPKIPPKEAVNKTINMLKKEINKREYKDVKKVVKKIGSNINSSMYNDFIQGKDYYVDIMVYDASKIAKGKDYDDDFEAGQEINAKMWEIIEHINTIIKDDGYKLDMSADSEILGEGGMTLEILHSF